jgi:hypothetical protein
MKWTRKDAQFDEVNNDILISVYSTKELDYVIVGEFFEELAEFLSVVDSMISPHNDWKAGMEAEYASNQDNY